MDLLKADEAPVFVLSKYVDVADVFSKDLVAKLPEYIGINDHVIDLIKGQHTL